MGKRIIEVRTNCVHFVTGTQTGHFSWTGSGKCSIAAAWQFQKGIHSVVYFIYTQLFPWTFHPLLDPMWSNESTQIVHDGAEASRMDKILRIASCPISRKLFCVSVGRIVIAVLTAGSVTNALERWLSLGIAGALQYCSTFPALNLEILKHIDAT